MEEGDSSYRRRALRWLERYSHFDTIWGAFSADDPVRVVVGWIAEAYTFKIVAGILTAVGFAIWAWVVEQSGPIIALIALIAFGAMIWLINGLAWTYQRFLRRALPENVDEVQPYPQEIDPAQRVFERRKVRLPDLVRDERNVISDKVFIDCDIYGPAVICLGGPVRPSHFTGVNIEGSAEVTFIEAAPPTSRGVLFLDNVEVIRGTFRNVIFVGPLPVITIARQQFQ